MPLHHAFNRSTLLLLIFQVLTSCFYNVNPSAENLVEKMFKWDRIAPDEIPLKDMPSTLLEVIYANNVKVELGKELTPRQVFNKPISVNYEPDDQNVFYTLLMVDIDAAFPISFSQRSGVDWLLVNIPGNNIKDAEIIYEYLGICPLKIDGFKRYVYLLYKQPSYIKFEEQYRKQTDPNRTGFSSKMFADKYNLGGAIAGNYFKAQFDDSVPELLKLIGFEYNED